MKKRCGGNRQLRKPNDVRTHYKDGTIVHKKHYPYSTGDDTFHKKEMERARIALNVFREEKRKQNSRSETFKLQRKMAYELAKEARTKNTRKLKAGSPYPLRRVHHERVEDGAMKKSSLSSRSIYSNKAGAHYINYGVGMDTRSRIVEDGRHADGSSSHLHSKKKKKIPCGQWRSSSNTPHVSSAESVQEHRVKDEHNELRHMNAEVTAQDDRIKRATQRASKKEPSEQLKRVDDHYLAPNTSNRTPVQAVEPLKCEPVRDNAPPLDVSTTSSKPGYFSPSSCSSNTSNESFTRRRDAEDRMHAIWESLDKLKPRLDKLADRIPYVLGNVAELVSVTTHKTDVNSSEVTGTLNNEVAPAAAAPQLNLNETVDQCRNKLHDIDGDEASSIYKGAEEGQNFPSTEEHSWMKPLSSPKVVEPISPLNLKSVVNETVAESHCSSPGMGSVTNLIDENGNNHIYSEAAQVKKQQTYDVVQNGECCAGKQMDTATWAAKHNLEDVSRQYDHAQGVFSVSVTTDSVDAKDPINIVDGGASDEKSNFTRHRQVMHADAASQTSRPYSCSTVITSKELSQVEVPWYKTCLREGNYFPQQPDADLELRRCLPPPPVLCDTPQTCEQHSIPYLKHSNRVEEEEKDPMSVYRIFARAIFQCINRGRDDKYQSAEPTKCLARECSFGENNESEQYMKNGGKVYANGIPNEAVTVDPELEKRQSLGFVDCACIRAAPNEQDSAVEFGEISEMKHLLQAAADDIPPVTASRRSQNHFSRLTAEALKNRFLAQLDVQNIILEQERKFTALMHARELTLAKQSAHEVIQHYNDKRDVEACIDKAENEERLQYQCQAHERELEMERTEHEKLLKDSEKKRHVTIALATEALMAANSSLSTTKVNPLPRDPDQSCVRLGEECNLTSALHGNVFIADPVTPPKESYPIEKIKHCGIDPISTNSIVEVVDTTEEEAFQPYQQQLQQHDCGVVIEDSLLTTTTQNVVVKQQNHSKETETDDNTLTEHARRPIVSWIYPKGCSTKDYDNNSIDDDTFASESGLDSDTHEAMLELQMEREASAEIIARFMLGAVARLRVAHRRSEMARVSREQLSSDE